MNLRTPRDLGALIRDRRKRSRLAQRDLAAKVGVSRQWIIDVEQGKPRAEIGLVLRTLEVLGVRLSVADEPAPGARKAPPVDAADIDAIVQSARKKRAGR